MSENIHTIPEIIQFWAEVNPEAEVFTFVHKQGRHGVYTPRELLLLSSRFAASLRFLGLSVGDVIANGLPNSPERLVTDLGIILAGCVPVNCQILERSGADFWNTARLADCQCVITSNHPDDTVYNVLSSYLPTDSLKWGCVPIHVPGLSSLKEVILVGRDPDQPGGSFLSNLKSGPEVEFQPHRPQPEDLAVLFTTSGSSGYCKLVPRSHREVLKCGRSFGAAKAARYFSDRPLGWMGGFPFDYLAHCSCRILQDLMGGQQAETCQDIWDVISRERCHGAAILPLDVVSLVHKFKDDQPDFRLSFLVTGGQPLRKNLTEALGLLTDALVVSYSSTEAAMVCVGMVTQASQFTDLYSGQPLTTAGVEVKVVDEMGNTLESGQEGQILIKSPLVMKSYYQQPAAEPVFTVDGWFRSGDRGHLDSTGSLYCSGRSGNVISKGAVLIYFSWPESILVQCPGVAEVAVLGVSQASGDECMSACVIPAPNSQLTENQLLEFYSSSLVQESSSNKDFMPELKHVIFFEQFPQTPSGKINRLALKKEVLKKLQET